MNEVEAIEYFEQLIRRFEDKPDESYWGREHNKTTRDMCNTAIAALREKLEREKEPEPLTVDEIETCVHIEKCLRGKSGECYGLCKHAHDRPPKEERA